jgi:hypothetical protein
MRNRGPLRRCGWRMDFGGAMFETVRGGGGGGGGAGCCFDLHLNKGFFSASANEVRERRL